MFITIYAVGLVAVVLAAFVIRTLQLIGKAMNDLEEMTYERDLMEAQRDMAEAKFEAVMQYKTIVEPHGQGGVLLPRSPFEFPSL